MKGALLALLEQLHADRGLSLPAELLPPRVQQRARSTGVLHWPDLRRSLGRLPIPAMQGLVLAALHMRPALLVLDTLAVPPGQAELLAEWLDAAQLAAPHEPDNRRVRIVRLLWRFPARVELKPLPAEDCRAIAEQWLTHHPLRFASPRTRERFLRHLAQASNGRPAAVLGILERAAAEEEITPAKAVAFHHESAYQYLVSPPR